MQKAMSRGGSSNNRVRTVRPSVSGAFDFKMYDKGKLNLTEYLFTKFDELDIKYLKTTLPCGTINDKRFCVHSIGLAAYWTNAANSFPWDKIISELKEKCIDRNKIPIFLSLDSTIVYDPVTLEPYGKMFVRFHKGFCNDNAYTIFGKKIH